MVSVSVLGARRHSQRRTRSTSGFSQRATSSGTPSSSTSSSNGSSSVASSRAATCGAPIFASRLQIGRLRGRRRSFGTPHALEHINMLAKKYLGEDKYPYLGPGERRVIIQIRPSASTALVPAARPSARTSQATARAASVAAHRQRACVVGGCCGASGRLFDVASWARSMREARRLPPSLSRRCSALAASSPSRAGGSQGTG